MASIYVEIMDWIEAIISFVAIIYMFTITAYKLLRERRERGDWNWVRMHIFLAFCVELYGAIIPLLFNAGVLPKSEPLYKESAMLGYGLNTVATGLIVVLGMSLTFYLFGMRRLLSGPYYFFLFGTLYFLFSGFDDWFPIFIVIGGIVSLASLYFVGFRLKENGALGLAVFYTITFMSVIVNVSDLLLQLRVGNFFSAAGYIFGVFFAAGRFTPFKPRETEAQETIPEDEEDESENLQEMNVEIQIECEPFSNVNDQNAQGAQKMTHGSKIEAEALLK